MVLVGNGAVTVEDLTSGLEDLSVEQVEDITKQKRNINVLKVILEAIQLNENKTEYKSYLKDSGDFDKYMALLLSLRDWLLDCELATKKEKEVIQVYVSSLMNITETARTLNTSKVAIRKHLSRFNTKVLEKLGEDMVIKLQEGKYSTAYELWRVRGNNVGLTDILPTDFLINLPEARFDVTCNLKDFEYELKLLRIYSIETMQRNISKGNERGLAYLLGLLMNDNVLYSRERHVVSEFIRGNIPSLEELYKTLDSLY